MKLKYLCPSLLSQNIRPLKKQVNDKVFHKTKHKYPYITTTTYSFLNFPLSPPPPQKLISKCFITKTTIQGYATNTKNSSLLPCFYGFVLCIYYMFTVYMYNYAFFVCICLLVCALCFYVGRSFNFIME